MRTRLVALAAAASLSLAALAGCSVAPVVAPVVVNAGDVQGSVVEVPINSTLVINTGSLPVDSYTATIANESVATFVLGKDDGSASFNPGLTPQKVGDTEVTHANEDGGIEDVEFTLKVVPIKAGTGIVGGVGD